MECGREGEGETRPAYVRGCEQGHAWALTQGTEAQAGKGNRREDSQASGERQDADQRGGLRTEWAVPTWKPHFAR